MRDLTMYILLDIAMDSWSFQRSQNIRYVYIIWNMEMITVVFSNQLHYPVATRASDCRLLITVFAVILLYTASHMFSALEKYQYT